MQTLAVLERSGEVTRLLEELLDKRHYALTRPRPEEPTQCALLVVSPDYAENAPRAVCRILLTPPDKSAQLTAVEAEWAVSFGPAARESISFSSLDEDGLTLCIRRALPTLSGHVLETQEIPLHCRAALPEEMLAACAAALIAR